MKKKEVVRDYNFSDAILMTKTKEKIAFIKRDIEEFAQYGITQADVTALENSIEAFSDSITDVEILGDQTGVTSSKDAKAETLREAIRSLMTRVVLKFTAESSKYRKFGTDALARQTDADLYITGKRVARVSNMFIDDLAEKGVTPAMIANITNLCKEFDNLLVDAGIAKSDRDILQEDRVEEANRIYAILSSYTNTGQSIWTTTNVAKYNDYVLYNTPTAEAPDENSTL